MKVGVIIQSNTKGQIVIPKQLREAVGMEPGKPVQLLVRGNGIYVSPITAVITAGESESSYKDILLKTQGTWADDDWEETQKQRKMIEKEASERRKNAW